MKLVFVAPLLALGLAACGQVGAIGIPLGGGPQSAATGQPTDFNRAAPTTAVETGTLPAAGGYDPGPVATTPPPGTPPTTTTTGGLAAPDAIGEPNQAGALAANTNVVIEEVDLMGAWRITLDRLVCQLSLSRTAMPVGTMGYRASVQPALGGGDQCSSTLLREIRSWSLDGQTVTLADSTGAPLATLAPVATLRFEGQVIAGGLPIVFYR